MDKLLNLLCRFVDDRPRKFTYCQPLAFPQGNVVMCDFFYLRAVAISVLLIITSVICPDFSSFQVQQRLLLLLHWQLLWWHWLRCRYLGIAHGCQNQVLEVIVILAQACLLGLCTCIFRIWRVHICSVVQFAFIVKVLAGMQIDLDEQLGLNAAKDESQS